MSRFRRGRVSGGVAPEAGMVTAELAVALPAVVLTAVAAVTFLSVLTAQLRALDAAGVAARLVARGESPAAVASAVHQLAGGAHLVVNRESADPRLVVVEVSTKVPVAGLGRLLPPFVIRERAGAPREPGQP